jgi:hypothetical protein
MNVKYTPPCDSGRAHAHPEAAVQQRVFDADLRTFFAARKLSAACVWPPV